MVFTRLRNGKGIIAVSLSVLMVRHALVGVFKDLGVGENRSLKSVKGRLSNAPNSDSQLQQNCDKKVYSTYLTHRKCPHKM